MSKLPRITIVTPSYNQARYLEKTIKSILDQDYPSLEYIIIDGASTDKSVEIIKKYEEYLTYWISKKDKGQSDAINKGFNRATGDLLCWVNADDVLFPGSLKKVAGVLQDNPRIEIVTGNTLYIDKDDIIIKSIRVPQMRWYLMRMGLFYFCAPAVFFRSELFKRTGGLDINLHLSMDVDLWHKFRLEKARIHHINEYLGGFRVHSYSKTIKIRKGGNIFENPETAILRRKYIPDISKTMLVTTRIFYKLWQIMNLNYLFGYLDFRKWNRKTWKEVFGK